MMILRLDSSFRVAPNCPLLVGAPWAEDNHHWNAVCLLPSGLKLAA
jgi:hypothetical protein